LSIIDRASGALRKRVPIGKNPEFVRIRGDFAFVSFEPAAVGGPPPAPGSEAAAALAKEREDDDAEPARIAVIDLQQGKVVREIVGGMETEGIEFSADGKRLLITNEADDNVSVHDIASGKLLRRISTKKYGSRPRGIKVAPDGKSYGVTLEYGNKLLILDTAFKVKKVIPTGDTPYGLAFDRAGKRILVALAKGGAIQVFDAKTFTEIGRGTTGKRCWHFTFTPNDQQILVACGKSNEVVVLDANSLQEVKRYPDFKTPWGVITWPKSVGSLDQP
jgi:DNA-binding beta-propeller fold protein YncE